jgi:hypothetical protein
VRPFAGSCLGSPLREERRLRLLFADDAPNRVASRWSRADAGNGVQVRTGKLQTLPPRDRDMRCSSLAGRGKALFASDRDERRRSQRAVTPRLRPLARDVLVGRLRDATERKASSQQPPAAGAAIAGDCRRGARGSGSFPVVLAKRFGCRRRRTARGLGGPRRGKPCGGHPGSSSVCASIIERRSVGSRTTAAKPKGSVAGSR